MVSTNADRQRRWRARHKGRPLHSNRTAPLAAAAQPSKEAQLPQPAVPRFLATPKVQQFVEWLRTRTGKNDLPGVILWLDGLIADFRRRAAL